MKNGYIKHSNLFIRIVNTGLFIAVCSLLLVACSFSFDNSQSGESTDNNIPHGFGSFSLRITGAQRTLMPDSPLLSDFAVFELAFTNTDDVSDIITVYRNAVNNGGILESVVLPMGVYTLTVNAYLDIERTKLAANGTAEDVITINSGANTFAEVRLKALLFEGTGTFNWSVNISTTGVTEASMTIRKNDIIVSGIGDNPVDLLSVSSGIFTLVSGIYNVSFKLVKNGTKEEAIWNEVLYIYSSLESKCEKTFGEDFFYHTHNNVLFNYNYDDITVTQSVEHGGMLNEPDNPLRSGWIFDGWWTEETSGVKWNFDTDIAEDITLYARWQELIITIDTHPAEITNVIAGYISGNLNITASVISNAALSYQWYSNANADNTDGVAISGENEENFAIPTTLSTGTYYYFCEVKTTCGAVSIRSNIATVTVTLPQLTGTVDISGTLQLGGLITANINNLNGTGTPSFQWMRGSTLIPGATNQTYTVTAADISQSITVTVIRNNYSGTITSNNLVVQIDRYIITGSYTSFRATRGSYSTTVGQIQNVIIQIKTHAFMNSVDSIIQFGNNGDLLDIQSAYIVFDDIVGSWSGPITLLGKITSWGEVPVLRETIAIGGNVSVTSHADIAARSFRNAILHESSGTLTISDGDVESSHIGILHTGTGSLVINGGMVRSNAQTVNNSSISCMSTGTVIISGGNVTAWGQSVPAISLNSGTLIISGGNVGSAGNSSSISGSIYVSGSNFPRLDITGGTVINLSSSGGNAIYNQASGGTVTISGGRVSASSGFAIHHTSALVVLSNSPDINGRIRLPAGRLSVIPTTFMPENRIYLLDFANYLDGMTAVVDAANFENNFALHQQPDRELVPSGDNLVVRNR